MIRRVFTIALPFLLFLLLWQTVAFLVEAIREVLFPTPWQTFVKLGRLIAGEPLSDALLYRHIGDSMLRWLAGFGSATAIGLVYGLAAGVCRRP